MSSRTCSTDRSAVGRVPRAPASDTAAASLTDGGQGPPSAPGMIGALMTSNEQRGGWSMVSSGSVAAARRYAAVGRLGGRNGGTRSLSMTATGEDGCSAGSGGTSATYELVGAPSTVPNNGHAA